jgi:hypothetical protein
VLVIVWGEGISEMIFHHVKLLHRRIVEVRDCKVTESRVTRHVFFGINVGKTYVDGSFDVSYNK